MRTEKWDSCYDDSWDGFIVPEAFAHPAKFSRGLITKIYLYMLAERMMVAGDVVVDPFGGIGCGGIVAASWGLRWLGCELEQKFVELGQRNIALHRALWESFKDPVPVLVQGDSRRLRENLRGVLADCCVSSPPFTGIVATGDPGFLTTCEKQKRIPSKSNDADYGQTPGQLGAMKPGDVAAVVSSPPYSSGTVHGGNGIDPDKIYDNRCGPHSSVALQGGYPNSAGQLGTMPPGQVDSVITSPPYAEVNTARNSNGIDKRKQWEVYRANGGGSSYEGFVAHQEKHSGDYGSSDGQLSRLPAGQVDSVVTSPPYEGSTGNPMASGSDIASGFGNGDISKRGAGRDTAMYGDADGQLGHTTGETFWHAARDIVAECYAILKPGGWSAFVVKAFVRNKQIVDFPGDWRKLCEACGFELVTEVHAMLVKEERHADLFGGDDHVKVTARKSFFRRLYEKKFPGNSIDYEVVQFFRKPLQ